MANQYDNIYVHLHRGETVKCPECKSGDIKPYNAPPDKAHNFYCSNEKCDFSLHIDPIINID